MIQRGDTSRRVRRVVVLVAAGLLVGMGGAPAQDGDDEPVGPERPAALERLFLPLDEDLEDGLRRVDELAARGQWDRVVEQLDRLLDEGRAELAPGDGEALRGARAVIRERLAGLPPDGKAVYAQLHDDAARRLLEQAHSSAELGPLLELAARHPVSRAVFGARTLLASRYLERGQPAAALGQLDALLERPGLVPEDRARLQRARAIALALLGRTGEAEDALERLGPAADDLRARLDALARAPGAAADAPPERPAERAWSQPVLGYYETEQGGTRPWSVPEVEGGLAYVHDGSHALCVDVTTGKLRWRTPLRPEDAFKRPAVDGEHRVILAPGLVVCLVPGVGVIGLERETGAERWRRGLPALERDAEIDFPTRLSGTPRRVGSRLVLVLVTEHETREVHALALELATGELAWTAYLASQTQGLVPQVELAGTDERVVVLTGLGLLVALDAQGEVLWARRYASVRDEKDERGGGGIPGMPRLGPGGELLEGPAERPERAPSAAVVRGTLWAAPADAKKLWALDLRTGGVEAVIERPERARIVAVRGTELVLLSAAGDVFVTTKAGSSLVAQAGGELIGRPVVAGARVYLPRTDGLVEVDLASRQARLAAPRVPELGHLAAADGVLVSAAPRGLFAFGRDAQTAPVGDDPLDALADARPGVRDAAQALLLALGERTRADVERALATTRDPEVSFRALTLLSELDRKERLATWGPLMKGAWAQQVPDLLNRLTHPNAEVRLEALRELGAVQDAEVGTLLVELLEDRDPRVTYTAAGALLVRGDRAGVDLLARAVTEGLPADRHAALVALGAAGEPEDMERALPALKDAEPEVRAAAAVAVLKLGGPAGLPHVRPLLADPEDVVRVAIVEGIVGRADLASLEVVAALARDPNDQVRSIAVGALAKVRDPIAYRALGRVLGDPVAAIAKQALDALNKIAQTEHVLLLSPDGLERAARAKDAQTRDYVAQLAIRYAGKGGVLSVTTISRFLSDEEPQIRRWRLRDAQGKRHTWTTLLLDHVRQFPCSPGDVAAIGSLVVHAEPDVRIKGYQVLGNAVFAPGAGALLAQGLDDEHPTIRQDAANWLTRAEAPPELLDDAAVLEVLRIAALSPRPEGKEAAEGVLAELPRGAVAPALVRALRVPNDALRAAAAARLATLSGVEAGDDPEGWWRVYAAWWWQETHPGQAVEQTVTRLADENPTVRWRAAQDLASLPTPAVRNSLAASLAGEPLDWVLEAKLEALVAVLGEPFGYKKGLPAAEKRACADRLRLRVVELIQDEVRGRAPR